MSTDYGESWRRFQRGYSRFPSVKLAIDLSCISISDDKLANLRAPFEVAFRSMALLESGTIANPDESRMVGHYWLRNPDLAPSPGLRDEIVETVRRIHSFVEAVHTHKIQGSTGRFENLLVIGIGGSALGPQLASHALGNPASDKLKAFFFDNTDPDGMERVLATIGDRLGQTLVIVISKSGTTQETYNGMIESRSAYEAAGLSFPAHAVAITGKDSKLDRLAASQSWLQRFPMWDWVGGRTSETSAVGLLPAALQGFDIDSILRGAAAMDALTRHPSVEGNPAALLALAWHVVGCGKGAKDMVILPYKDRLELMSRYLQQLVMESIGKESDLEGRIVNQGIAVYGNKGSTDQHAYIQQLRDGLHNFFVTFIEVLRDRSGADVWVSEGTTSGDYLQGFYLGTRAALNGNGRESLTLTLDEVSPFTLGVLIALFERAVGFYASLVGINAYHQPGVEAGKRAAQIVIEKQRQLFTFLRAHLGARYTVEDLAQHLGGLDSAEILFKVCQRLVQNPARGIRSNCALNPFATLYWAETESEVSKTSQ